MPLYALSTAVGAEPVSVAPHVAFATDPEWRPDGQQFLYVEHFCCGNSNGAYTVDVSGNDIEEPVAIHEPLTGGETVRNALYLESGETLVAQFSDEADVAHWAIRPANGDVGSWATVTPGAEWPGGVRIAVPSPDGRAIVLGDGADVNQRLYLVDLEATAPTGVLVHEAGSPEQAMSQVLWSPSSDAFILNTAAAGAFWIARDGSPAEALPLSTNASLDLFRDIAFSPDGSSVLFTGWASGLFEGLFVAPLTDSGPGSLTTVVARPSVADVFDVYTPRWIGNDRIVMLSDVRNTNNVNELLLGDLVGSPLEPISDVDEDIQFAYAFGTEVVFSAGVFNGNQNLYRVSVADGAPSASVALTSFGGEAPTRIVVLAASEEHLYFLAAVDNPAPSARVYYLSPASEPVPVSGVLKWLNDYSVALSPDGRFFAYAGWNADDWQTLLWTELVNGVPSQPRGLGNVSNEVAAVIQTFAWQP